MLRHAASAVFLTSALFISPLAQAQQGLRVPEEPVLRMRLHLLSLDAGSGSRLLGAQLLGDYYLIGQGNGLRLSGGLMLGPASLAGSGLAPARPAGLLGLSHRRLLGSREEERISQPYLGVGFSRHGSAWGFTADLGVAVRGGSGLRLDSSTAFAQSLDDSLRRLQWTPMLQLGLNYRF